MRANTIGLIAGTIAVASSANAGLVIGDIISVSRQSGDGHLVTANYDGSRASNASGVTGGQLARAGSMVFNYNSVNGTAVGGQFVSFCVELGEGFPDDPISYTIFMVGSKLALRHSLNAVKRDYPGILFTEIAPGKTQTNMLQQNYQGTRTDTEIAQEYANTARLDAEQVAQTIVLSLELGLDRVAISARPAK